MQPVVRRSLRLQEAKEDVKKEEEARKDFQEDDSVVTDVETYSDFESPGGSGEASQRILSSCQKRFAHINM